MSIEEQEVRLEPYYNNLGKIGGPLQHKLNHELKETALKNESEKAFNTATSSSQIL